MVKYWPDKGKSGFLVWRYLLKRDDDEPAPWTRDGKERIKKLGLTMQVEMIIQSTLDQEAISTVFSALLGRNQLMSSASLKHKYLKCLNLD